MVQHIYLERLTNTHCQDYLKIGIHFGRYGGGMRTVSMKKIAHFGGHL